ncbi:hypothetical protein B484DRAFT_388940, partial [Ochromonadaceae sp. CCMP2298]
TLLACSSDGAGYEGGRGGMGMEGTGMGGLGMGGMGMGGVVRPLLSLMEGDHLGTFEMIFGDCPDLDAQTNGFTEVAELSFASLLEVIGEFEFWTGTDTDSEVEVLAETHTRTSSLSTPLSASTPAPAPVAHPPASCCPRCCLCAGHGNWIGDGNGNGGGGGDGDGMGLGRGGGENTQDPFAGALPTCCFGRELSAQWQR